MKVPLSTRAYWRLLISALALAGLSARSQELPELPGTIATVAAHEVSTLDRVTHRVTSSADLTITNNATAGVFGPLHAVVRLSGANGVAVPASVTVAGASGGLGLGEYGAFFFDLSSRVPQGFQPGQSLAVPLRIERPASPLIFYQIEMRGHLNAPPVADPGGPYAGTAGGTIPFDGSRSRDPDDDPLTFLWRFDDGTTADSAQPQHTFALPGLHEISLTVTDGRGGESVKLVTVAITPDGPFALGRTRVLDGSGHPLPGAEITETGPGGERTFNAGAETAFASLGGLPGTYTWRFSAPGHLPVWRTADLAPGVVTAIPSPWLAKIPAQGVPVSLLENSNISSADGSVALLYPAGAFAQSGDAVITPLSGQSLPSPLPLGWSLLASFHLDLPDPGAQMDAAATLKLPAPFASGGTLFLVRYDRPARAWITLSALSGNGTATLAASLRDAGDYALAHADAPPTAPPAPVVGDALAATTASSALPAAGLTAIGSVTPSESPASTDPERVTGAATVDFTSPSALPSGVWFRTTVEETYDLKDGGRFRAPDYDATIFAWQGTADANPATLRASFPLRPRLLLGPDILAEARLHVEVLTPGDQGTSVFNGAGGQITDGSVRLTIPAGAVGGLAAGELRRLDPAAFTGFAGGLIIADAFALDLAGLLSGSELAFSYLEKLDPLSDYVLARVVTAAGSNGLQPVLRLRSDAAGFISSVEPAAAPRLPGIDRAGQYLIVKLTAPQGLISGQVRLSTDNSPAPGAAVRVTGQPWMALTPNTGAWALLASAGSLSLTAIRDGEGFTGRAAAEMPAALTPITADILIGSAAPFVLATSPAADASKVPVVTPITVTFSERISPASFAAGVAVSLLDPANAAVPASLTLDLTNRIATLLPLNPLTPATDYKIVVSAGLRDLQNLALDGPREFAFTTAAPAARGEGAQLTIFQPDAINLPPGLVIPGYNPAAKLSRVVAVGNAGTADPEVPVILVNESTGETATVLSKPDGSFANFVTAAEEDFISAVFVNSNGTRITIPASKQKFDDGRTGLYKAGGILEAESDGGPVQVIVEPNSVPARTIFRLDPLTLQEVQDLVGGVQPEGGRALGGVKFQEEGDLTKVYSNLTFAVNVADLGLAPGTDPATAGFALTVPRRVEGTVIYEVVDSMSFRPTGPGKGELFTASPPFVGLLLREIAALRSQTGLSDTFAPATRTIANGVINVLFPVGTFLIPVVFRDLAMSNVHGTVYTQQEVELVDDPTVVAAFASQGQPPPPKGPPSPLVPLPGALIRVAPTGIDFLPNILRAGEFVAVSDQEGKYMLRLMLQLRDQVVATHRRFPFVTVRSGFANAGLISGAKVDYVFTLKKPQGLAIFDNSQPLIEVRQLSSVATVGNGANDGLVLDVVAVDDIKLDDVTVQLSDFTTLIGNVSIFRDLTAGEVAAMQPTLIQSDDDPSPGRSHERYRIKSARSGRATYLVTAADGGTAGLASLTYTVPFTTAAPPANDPTKRVVTFVWPPKNAEHIARGTPIKIRFSKALTPDLIPKLNAPPVGGRPQLVSVGPPGVNRLHIELAPDLREITVYYWLSDPNAELLTLALDPELAVAEPAVETAGPDGMVQPFSGYEIKFAKANSLTVEQAVLPNQFGGVVQAGRFVYVIERTLGGEPAGILHHYEIVKNGENVSLKHRTQRPFSTAEGRPMDLVVVPSYPLRLPNGVIVKEENYLVVYAGNIGVPGDDQIAQLKRAFIFRLADDGTPLETDAYTKNKAPVLGEGISTITRAKWDPPFLGYLEIGSDNTSVVLTTFNGLINGVEARLANLFSQITGGIQGVDLDNNGDFTGPNDVAPLPPRLAGQTFGVEFSWAPTDARERVNDYDLSADFGLLGAVFRGPNGNGLAMVLGGPLGPLDDVTARVTFVEEPKRMKILPRQPLLNSDGSEIVRDIALVSCVNTPGGLQRSVLLVVDISLPNQPVKLIRAEMPVGLGSLNSIVERGDGLLAVSATPGGLFLLDPRLLLLKNADGTSAAVRQQLAGVETNVSSFVSSSAGLNFGNQGSTVTAVLSQPQISVVRFDGTAPQDAALIAAEISNNNNTGSGAWDRRLLKLRNVERNAGSALFNADAAQVTDPRSHLYVIIQAPGVSGGAEGELALAAAAVNESGLPVLPSPSNRAPCFVGDDKLTKKIVFFGAMKAAHFLADIDFAKPERNIIEQLAGKLLNLTVQNLIDKLLHGAPSYPSKLIAHRLSDNPASPLYNTFLAGPVVLLHRDAPVDSVDANNDAGGMHRTYLRASPYFWVGLAPKMTDDPFLGPFTSTQVDDLDATFNAKLDTLYGELRDIVGHAAAGNEAVAFIKVIQSVVKRINVELETSMHPGHVALVNFGFRRNPLILLPGVMASRLRKTTVDEGNDARWVSIQSALYAHLGEWLGSFTTLPIIGGFIRDLTGKLNERMRDITFGADGQPLEAKIDTDDILRRLTAAEVFNDLANLPIIGGFIGRVASFVGVQELLEAVNKPIYQNLILYLQGFLGYDEYLSGGGQEGLTKEGAIWPSLKTNPDLFIFPYDWREDNAASAVRLEKYVELIRLAHPDTPKVDLMGHSMGGLVARNYAMKNPDKVDRFISICTPFLGATKALYALNRGDFDEHAMNVLVPSLRMKILARHMPAVHQLMPSRGMFDLGFTPIRERGFDLDGDGDRYELLDFDEYLKVTDGIFFRTPKDELAGLNAEDEGILRTPPKPISKNNEPFHKEPGTAAGGTQDDWSADTSSIRYTHFVCLQSTPRTISSLDARPVLVPEELKPDVSLSLPPVAFFDSEEHLGTDMPILPDQTIPLETDPKKTFRLTWIPKIVRGAGDSTVPFLSQSRGYHSDKDMNAPRAEMYVLLNPSDRPEGDETLDELVGHNGCLLNPQLLAWVGKALQDEIIKTKQPSVVIGGGGVTEGQPATFTAGITNKPTEPGLHEKVFWDMGDGTVLHGVSVNHAYENDGTFTVTCSVSYEPGEGQEQTFDEISRRLTFSAVTSLQIEVLEASPAYTITGPNEIAPGKLATFRADVSGPARADAEKFVWDFGDGSTAIVNDENYVVDHVYLKTGTFTVTLSVTDDDGSASPQSTVEITVTDSPAPALAARGHRPRATPAPVLSSADIERLEFFITGNSADPDDLEIVHDSVEVYDGESDIDSGSGLIRRVATEPSDTPGRRVDQILVPRLHFTGGVPTVPNESIITVTGAEPSMRVKMVYFNPGSPPRCFNFDFAFDTHAVIGKTVDFLINWEQLPALTDPNTLIDTGLVGAFLLEDAHTEPCEDRGPSMNFTVFVADDKIQVRADDDSLPDVAPGGTATDDSTVAVGLPGPPLTLDDTLIDGQPADDDPCQDEQVSKVISSTATRDAPPGLTVSTDSQLNATTPGPGDCPQDVADLTDADIKAVQDAVKSIFRQAKENVVFKKFVFNLNDLWILEQGSGALLWKSNSTSLTDEQKKAARAKLRGTYVKGKSDNDYEIFLPVFKSPGRRLNVGDANTQAVFPSLAHTKIMMEGDWYFSRPVGLLANDGELGPLPDLADTVAFQRYVRAAAKWRYDILIAGAPEGTPLSGESTLVISKGAKLLGEGPTEGSVFDQPATPAEVISYVLTHILKDSANEELRKILPDASFFPFRREHFDFGYLSLEKPPPFGDDPVGDAGMGRQLLLLKWLLEGAFLPKFDGFNEEVPNDLAKRGEIFQRLAAQQESVTPGAFEWGIFQQWAILKEATQFRVRPRGVHGADSAELRARAKCREVFGNYLDAHDQKVMKKVGKACIRAALARLAADPDARPALFGTTPKDFEDEEDLRSFEHLIADIARTEMAANEELFPGFDDEDITDFLAAKSGSIDLFCRLQSTDDGLEKFIIDGNIFLKLVQQKTVSAYAAFGLTLADGARTEEMQIRRDNARDIDFGFTGFDAVQPGREQLLGRRDNAILSYPFIVSLSKNQRTDEVGGLRVILDPGGPNPIDDDLIICPPETDPALTIPADKGSVTLKHPPKGNPVLALRRPAAQQALRENHEIFLVVEDAAFNKESRNDRAKLESEILSVDSFEDRTEVPEIRTRWVYRGFHLEPQGLERLRTQQLASRFTLSPAAFSGIAEGTARTDSLISATLFIDGLSPNSLTKGFTKAELQAMNEDEQLALFHISQFIPDAYGISTGQDRDGVADFARRFATTAERIFVVAMEVPFADSGNTGATGVEYAETLIPSGGEFVLRPVNVIEGGGEIVYFYKLNFQRAVLWEAIPVPNIPRRFRYVSPERFGFQP